MKKFYLIFLFFALNTVNIFTQQSGWFWQNPLPQAEDIIYTQFINSQTGYGVTTSGTILKTTNAGLIWQCIPTLDNRNTSGCFFFNELTGYIAGAKSKLEKTTDGGNTWVNISVQGNPPDYGFTSINFINSTTGILGGAYSYKTTDGGINWTRIPIANNVHYIKFINNNTGFLTRIVDFYINGLQKTTDGGQTWVTKLTTSYYNVTPKFDFVNDTLGYTNMNNGYKTTDGGNNWFYFPSPVPPGNSINDIKFLNNNTAYCVSAVNFTSFIAKTTNNGFSWDTLRLTGDIRVEHINFFDGLTGIIYGSGGNICRTSNGGLNWSYLNSGIKNIWSITKIQFTDNQTGYVCGGDTLFAKTTNGGNNWIKLNLNSNSSAISSLYFFNNLTGFFAAQSHTLGKTTNGGVNWNIIPIQNGNYNLVCINFVNSNTGFIGCLDGYLLKTTNAGFNWSLNYSISSPAFNDIFFINENTGFVTGNAYGSPILKTTNTGSNWSIYNTNLNGLGSICFVNNNTGYAVGNYTILKTTNCGINWINSFTAQIPLTSVFFSSPNTGYAIGFYGEFVKTTNEGASWTKLHSMTRKDLCTLYFIDDLTGFIAGSNSIILKTTTGGSTVSIEKLGKTIPQNYFLQQNYPNPFNPITKIKFDVPKEDRSQKLDVRLVIYDVLGREVATI
ncbi:MAG: hypothetical protein EHM58_18685, partial [Ignavibacteriae bacterium]